jgi:hypothetical protein
MEHPYNEVVKEGQTTRGVGLGLRKPGNCTATGCNPDQLNPGVATIAMKTRIVLRTNICKNHGCTSTDIFIVAALAENESIYPNDIRYAFKAYGTTGSTVIDWKNYLKYSDTASNDYTYNQGLIVKFSKAVLGLQSTGWYVPSDIDWNYIENLPYP